MSVIWHWQTLWDVAKGHIKSFMKCLVCVEVYDVAFSPNLHLLLLLFFFSSLYYHWHVFPLFWLFLLIYSQFLSSFFASTIVWPTIVNHIFDVYLIVCAYLISLYSHLSCIFTDVIEILALSLHFCIGTLSPPFILLPKKQNSWLYFLG